MPGKTKLVSIIIPAYNADPFIADAIKSIIGQTYQYWEMVIVDDGSTDDTAAIGNSFNDSRIKIIRQNNTGVTTARNNGLKCANGEFIVFFDADDMMSPDFLLVRLNVLEKESEIGYVGGLVETFPIVAKAREAAGFDPVNEILFFNPSFVTIPSNYLFRREILVNNNISFNNQLSSSADRFFILEVSKFASGKNVLCETGKLLYRHTNQSMSNKVTRGLIIDNERFYYELKKKKLLPAGQKHKFKSFYFLSLAKGFGLIRYWKMVAKYLWMSFVNDPVFFARAFGKNIFNFSFFKPLTKNA